MRGVGGDAGSCQVRTVEEVPCRGRGALAGRGWTILAAVSKQSAGLVLGRRAGGLEGSGIEDLAGKTTVEEVIWKKEQRPPTNPLLLPFYLLEVSVSSESIRLLGRHPFDLGENTSWNVMVTRPGFMLCTHHHISFCRNRDIESPDINRYRVVFLFSSGRLLAPCDQ